MEGAKNVKTPDSFPYNRKKRKFVALYKMCTTHEIY